MRIVRRRGEADFGQFESRPSAAAGEGEIGIDHREAIAFREADDVFIVKVMSEQAGDRVEIGEVSVIEHAIMEQSDGSEAHGGHEIVGLGLGDQRASDIYFHMRLGNDRGEILVFGIDGESFQAVGRLGKEDCMEARADEIITKGAGVHAMI